MYPPPPPPSPPRSLPNWMQERDGRKSAQQIPPADMLKYSLMSLGVPFPQEQPWHMRMKERMGDFMPSPRVRIPDYLTQEGPHAGRRFTEGMERQRRHVMPTWGERGMDRARSFFDGILPEEQPPSEPLNTGRIPLEMLRLLKSLEGRSRRGLIDWNTKMGRNIRESISPPPDPTMLDRFRDIFR